MLTISKSGGAANWTLAKAAFLANRYWTLLIHVPITLNASWADISEARCKRIYWMQVPDRF